MGNKNRGRGGSRCKDRKERKMGGGGGGGEKRRGSGEQKASVSMVTSSFRSTEIRLQKMPWTIYPDAVGSVPGVSPAQEAASPGTGSWEPPSARALHFSQPWTTPDGPWGTAARPLTWGSGVQAVGVGWWLDCG